MEPTRKRELPESFLIGTSEPKKKEAREEKTSVSTIAVDILSQQQVNSRIQEPTIFSILPTELFHHLCSFFRLKTLNAFSKTNLECYQRVYFYIPTLAKEFGFISTSKLKEQSQAKSFIIILEQELTILNIQLIKLSIQLIKKNTVFESHRFVNLAKDEGEGGLKAAQLKKLPSEDIFTLFKLNEIYEFPNVTAYLAKHSQSIVPPLSSSSQTRQLDNPSSTEALKMAVEKSNNHACRILLQHKAIISDQSINLLNLATLKNDETLFNMLPFPEDYTLEDIEKLLTNICKNGNKNLFLKVRSKLHEISFKKFAQSLFIPTAVGGNIDIFNLLPIPENWTNENKKEMLEIICNNGDEKFFFKLKSVVPENDFNTFAQALLPAVAEKGSVKMMKALLKSDVKINEMIEVGPEGKKSRITLLGIAAKSGKEEMVKCLLDNKADPNLCDLGSPTPLELSLKSGHTNISTLLIANREKYNVKFSPQETLYQALLHTKNATNVLALLVEVGADVNHVSDSPPEPVDEDENEWLKKIVFIPDSPLTFALKNTDILSDSSEIEDTELKRLFLIKELLRLGADPFKGEEGKTPFCAALIAGDLSIVEFFLNECPKVPIQPLLHTALSLVQMWEDNGYDPYKKFDHIIDKLIEYGAQVNKDALSYLIRAPFEHDFHDKISQGFKNVVSKLIGLGADPTSVSADEADEMAWEYVRTFSQ